MADIKPLYRKTVGQAKMLGEIGDWRESFRENIACARAIDATIRDGYDGMHLREGIAEDIVGQYGIDRVAWVLAATLHEKEYDGRFSPQNKAWGEGQRISWDRHSCEYCCYAHPVLVDEFIDRFRKLQQSQAQLPETMKIRIFQINHDRDSQRVKFCGLEELAERQIDSAIYPFDDNAIICGNEEAKLEGLEGNRRVFGSVYCGNLFIIGDNQEGGCMSLTDEQIQKYGEMFAQPEDISAEEVQADTGFIVYGF